MLESLVRESGIASLVTFAPPTEDRGEGGRQAAAQLHRLSLGGQVGPQGDGWRAQHSARAVADRQLEIFSRVLGGLPA